MRPSRLGSALIPALSFYEIGDLGISLNSRSDNFRMSFGFILPSFCLLIAVLFVFCRNSPSRTRQNLRFCPDSALLLPVLSFCHQSALICSCGIASILLLFCPFSARLRPVPLFCPYSTFFLAVLPLICLYSALASCGSARILPEV